METAVPSWSPRKYRNSGTLASSSMKGSSVVPGLPKTRSTPSLWASSISRRAAFIRLDRVLARVRLDHGPVDVCELLDRRRATEPAPAALLHSAEGHLRLV